MTYLVFLFSILPGFVWLLFFLEEDADSEPKLEVLYAFVGGAAVAILVLIAEQNFNEAMAILRVGQYSYPSLFGLAFIEEFFKFTAAYIVVSRSRYFDLPVDAMVYMIVTALGFATLENIGAVGSDMNATSLLSTAVQTATLRFVGATLLHTLASGTVGFYWARGILNHRVFSYVAFGLLVATVLHSSFNYIVVTYNNLIFYPIILLIVAAFFILNDFETLKHPEKENLPFFKRKPRPVVTP